MGGSCTSSNASGDMMQRYGHIKFYNFLGIDHVLLSYVGEQKSDFEFQGRNTVHKGILEIVLYSKGLTFRGGFPPFAHVCLLSKTNCD